MREQQLLRVLDKTLRNYYEPEQIVTTNDYVYAVGDIPVALLAHLDTVHPNPPVNLFHDREKGVIWTPEGLGADDRAGVFGILMLLQAGYRPSVIFLTQEEVGGNGAAQFVKDWPEPASPVNFLVELDRQGRDDAVYYECGNADFENFISGFGFVTDWGTFSDIAVIAPVWDRAAVNLSIGYFDEHTRCERLFYRYTFTTIDRVGAILENCGNEPFKFEAIDWSAKAGWGRAYGWPTEDDYEKYGDYVPRAAAGMVMCDGCDTWVPKDSITIALDEDSGDRIRVCPSCTSRHITFCKDCGIPFVNINGTRKDGYCESCFVKRYKNSESKTTDTTRG